MPVALPTRRVHISQSTMDCLKGEFDVEPGDGGSRCDYLDEKGIETYLIIASGPYVKKSSQNGSVRPGGIWYAGWDPTKGVQTGQRGHTALLMLPIPTQVPNGLPTASRPNTPILIETKEPNGGTHTNGSTTEEPQEQEGEVRTRG